MTTKTTEPKLVLKPQDAIQMEFQAHLMEYESLYKNMSNGMEGARQILLHSFLISAGAIPVLTVLVQQQIYVALLLLPIVLTSALWLFQYHLYATFVAGAYLRQVLIPKVEAITRPSGINWPSRGRIWEFEYVFSIEQATGWRRLIFKGLGSFTTLAAHLLLILSSLISLGAFWVVRGSFQWEWWETTLFILDIVLIVAVMLFSVVSLILPNCTSTNTVDIQE